MTDKLEICPARFLTAGSGGFGNGDTVLFDQLSIADRWVFAIRDFAKDVKPVAMSQIGAGDLLNESIYGSCNESIGHTPSLQSKLKFVPTAQTSKKPNPDFQRTVA